MEILEAYDLTGSYRAAAVMAGCSHHTVKAHVAARAAGKPIATREPRGKVTDAFAEKITEMVVASNGSIRADKVHERLARMGYTGSGRSTRRAVAEAKKVYEKQDARVHRPWVTEPGLWLQYDYGDGPVVAGVKTVLFVAWLAYSRFRVVIPLRDKTLASVFMVLDRTFRILGGVPTYVLTDNEKTVTTMHIASVPVRNRDTVSFAKYYGTTVLTCAPADPASKGGVERSVRIAKADLVPTMTNLLDEYSSFTELEQACEVFMEHVNTRIHTVTKRRPVDVLAEEVEVMHPVPERAHTTGFGVSRKVAVNTPMVTFDNGQYSVPHTLMGADVMVRVHGVAEAEEIIIVTASKAGPVEVARHHRARPGSPAINDTHFPTDPGRKVPGDYTVVARTDAEAEFVSIGHGASAWLKEAAAAGTTKIRVKMAEAVTLDKLHGVEVVDEALGAAALHGRFGHGDLASLLANRVKDTPVTSTDQVPTLAQGTSGWDQLGSSCTPTQPTAGAAQTRQDGGL